MWSLLPRQSQLLIIIALGVLGASLAAAITDLTMRQERPPVFFITITATLISFMIIPLADALWRPLWRFCPVLNRLLFPDLNGVWRGEAIPVAAGGGREEIRPVTVTIRQGLFDVTVSLVTDQLESHTNRATVELDRKAQKFRIRYAYEGRPPPHLAKTNPRHEGSAYLEADLGGASDSLTGRYFTDRQTAGALSLKRVHAPKRARRRSARGRSTAKNRPSG